MSANEWVPVKWINGSANPIIGSPEIHRVSQIDGPDRFAVRHASCCLNKKGKWEYEPIPSSRTKNFFKRCRFDSFEDAVAQIEKIKETP